MPARLRVTLTKSIVSTTAEARGTVRALGLHRIGESVDLPDNPATRGMVRAVRYLVSFEASPEADAPKRAARRNAAPEESQP